MSYRSLPAGRDAPPLRQLAEWDTVASGVAETMQGYLAQLMLTRRPATVRQVEGTLREFALFLSQEAADVSRVSDIVAVTSRPIDSGWQSAQPMDLSLIHI